MFFMAGFAHVNRAFFVAFAQNTQAIIVNIAKVEPRQLRNSQAAVQKYHQNRKIPMGISALYARKQRLSLVQCQIFWQRTAELGKLDIRCRVFRQLLGADGQILEKGLDGRKLSGSGGIFHAFAGMLGLGAVDPVVAQIHEELVDLRGGDPGDEVQIHVFNRNLIEVVVIGQPIIPEDDQEAEEHPEIQIVFGDRAPGLSLDGFVIG